MGIFGSGKQGGEQQLTSANDSPDDRAARKAVEKAETERRKSAEREAKEVAKHQQRFMESPAGKARMSYQRGDQIYQVSFDIENVKANVAIMMNAFTTRSANDVSEVLNSVIAEGWDFCTLSTTFVSEGEELRDKFMASGQQVAIRGRVVGTYVFTRKVDRSASLTVG